MKLAIPVKTNKENPAVSPLFGKAKWFAFVDIDGKIDIKQNVCNGAVQVINWLIQENVEVIIFQEIGTAPYSLMKDMETITLFYSGYDRLFLSEVIRKFKNDELLLIDDTNIETIIAKHKFKLTH